MKYSYEKGLRDYSRHSDEKILLARAVGNIVTKNRVHSLLDVGAGEGTFASMIAPQVAHYVAVEKRKKNVSALRDRGLEVIEKDFPFEVDTKFDMVLASHSIPNDTSGFEEFIERLVSSAAPNGTVCVITYKTDKDPWYQLMHDVMGENWHAKNYDTYEMLFDVLKQHGDVHVEKIDTTVRGKTARELFAAMRFIYAGKNPGLAHMFNGHRAKILVWINQNCKSAHAGYEFPFYQYVVTLKKGQNPWAKLIHHERHDVNIGGATITVEDGVFTPDPNISYSSSMIVNNLPDVTGKRIADVGTGSGVIATITAMRGASEVIATDISDAAIENAKSNIMKHDVTDVVKVLKTNLLDNAEGTFDYIFANIPITDDNVWNIVGIDAASTLRDFFESAKSRLNQGGEIYLPWGSFAEEKRKDLEDMLKNHGYTFDVRTKTHLGYTWYLYTIRAADQGSRQF